MALISQQRILLVGLGSIGRATAAKLKTLGATVVGVSRHDDPVDNVDEVVSPDYNASFLTWNFGLGAAMSVLLLLVTGVYLLVLNRRSRRA